MTARYGTKGELCNTCIPGWGLSDARQAPRGNRQLSAKEYRDLAARWRRLAAEATTPHTRNHLLKLARQCEALALGPPGTARDEPDDPEFLGASS